MHPLSEASEIFITLLGVGELKKPAAARQGVRDNFHEGSVISPPSPTSGP
jgi:hypothetical protein